MTDKKTKVKYIWRLRKEIDQESSRRWGGEGGEMSVGKKSLRKADVRKAGGVLMHTKHNCAVLDFLNTLLLLSNSCGCRLDTLVQTVESTLARKHTIDRSHRVLEV